MDKRQEAWRFCIVWCIIYNARNVSGFYISTTPSLLSTTSKKLVSESEIDDDSNPGFEKQSYISISNKDSTEGDNLRILDIIKKAKQETSLDKIFVNDKERRFYIALTHGHMEKKRAVYILLSILRMRNIISKESHLLFKEKQLNEYLNGKQIDKTESKVQQHEPTTSSFNSKPIQQVYSNIKTPSQTDTVSPSAHMISWTTSSLFTSLLRMSSYKSETSSTLYPSSSSSSLPLSLASSSSLTSSSTTMTSPTSSTSPPSSSSLSSVSSLSSSSSSTSSSSLPSSSTMTSSTSAQSTSLPSSPSSLSSSLTSSSPLLSSTTMTSSTSTHSTSTAKVNPSQTNTRLSWQTLTSETSVTSESPKYLPQTFTTAQRTTTDPILTYMLNGVTYLTTTDVTDVTTLSTEPTLKTTTATPEPTEVTTLSTILTTVTTTVSTITTPSTTVSTIPTILSTVSSSSKPLLSSPSFKTSLMSLYWSGRKHSSPYPQPHN